MAPTLDIERTLSAWRAGDAHAANLLFTLTYEELRAIARRQLARLSPGETLAPTVLVHELYLRFIERSAPHAVNSEHFYAIAAHAMRHVIIDYVRKRYARKRDGGVAVPFGDFEDVPNDRPETDLIELDEALIRLEALDWRQARIAELRFFGGLSVEQIAASLEISDRTVKREWAKARAFLYCALH